MATITADGGHGLAPGQSRRRQPFFARLRQSPRPSGTGGAKTRKDSYSRFVGTMKFLLPAAAASMLILLLLWPQMMKVEDGHFRVGFLSNLTLNTLENLTLVRAKYVGTDREQRPYMVTAEMANQDSPDADRITLSAPAADITLHDGKWLALTAKSGEFRQHSQQLRLWGEVSVFHDDGYSFHTETARVDIKQGYAESHDPVVGYGPAGSLKADGFRVIDKGRRIVFTGNARLVINPNADDSVGAKIRKLSR